MKKFTKLGTKLGTTKLLLNFTKPGLEKCNDINVLSGLVSFYV
jgi:hypothetical protein